MKKTTRKQQLEGMKSDLELWFKLHPDDHHFWRANKQQYWDVVEELGQLVDADTEVLQDTINN